MPVRLSRFVTILMIPAPPSASNLAEAFVMISIFSTAAAGILSRASCGSSTEGLPSIITVKFELPRRETFPSISTSTEGTFSRISTAVPPLAERNCDASITRLSILYETAGFSASTKTSPIFKVSGFNMMVPTSTFLPFKMTPLNCFCS